MMRVDNWDRRLVEFAASVRGLDFEWGVTDCASLVRRGLRAAFDKDVWRGSVGKWSTRRGAITVSRRTDYENALRASGAIEVGVAYGWSGDVALGPNEDDHGMLQMALVVPSRKALTATPDNGVVIVDALKLQAGTKFFRYGADL